MLSAAGAIVVDIPLAELAEIAQINAPAASRRWRPRPCTAPASARSAARFDPRVAARVDLGMSVSAADYIVMQDRRRDWIGRVEGALEGFDALLCPTVPIVAPAIDALATDEAFFKANGLLLRNTFAINFLDGCAFSLPCQREGELPVGLDAVVGARRRRAAGRRGAGGGVRVAGDRGEAACGRACLTAASQEAPV